MIKVVTTIPKKRLERYGIEVPDGVNLIYRSRKSSQEELLEAAKDAEVIFSSLTEISRDLIEGCKNLKLIQSEGVGFDEIDIEAARENGVYVSNARGVNKDGVAEFTLGLMIDLLRGITRSNKAVLKSKYNEFYKDYETSQIRSLKDCRVGIIGMGDIGQEVVERLIPFTDNIVYFNRSRKEDLEKKYGIDYLDLEELYKTCDIISLHLPLNDETKHMINRDSLNLMKEDAIIINTARGDLIEQDDLAEALIEKKIAGAGLDTMSPEPPSEDHPLLNLPKEVEDNLVLTAHVAGVTGSAMKNMQKIGWKNIERIRLGQRPDNIVNKL